MTLFRPFCVQKAVSDVVFSVKSVSRMKSVGNETEQLVLRSLVQEQLGMVSRLLGLLIILLYLLEVPSIP